MIVLTQQQLEAWITAYFWPFMRIAACIMVAPVFGARFVPARLRIVLAGAVAILVAPLLLPAPAVPLFSLASFIIATQQILIGLIVGLALQFIFDAVVMGGQLIANSMGLSFAFNVDPMRGAATPALGQFYTLLVTLTFLAINGHVALIEAIVDGFATLPIGTQGIGAGGLWAFLQLGAQLFAGAVAIALPAMTALLIVNVAFGVISRAAPTLNLFAVGFPVTLVFGLVIVYASLPALQAVFLDFVDEAFARLSGLQALGR
jgi:flagellar biosynthetic protein FliR